MFFGIILIALGGIFLLENAGIFTGDVWGYFWPIVLIILGIRVLFKQSQHKTVISSSKKEDKEEE